MQMTKLKVTQLIELDMVLVIGTISWREMTSTNYLVRVVVGAF